MSASVLRKNLVLFGAPGVGKGTYGKLITKEFGWPTFSMGDYFRNLINNADTADSEDKWVTELRDTLRRGHFVDDDTAIKVIENARQTMHKDTELLILDGMPRTVVQA